MLPPRCGAVATFLLFATAIGAQTQVDAFLSAAPGQQTFGPGPTESAWVYNGTMPGPLLRVTEGQRLRVHFLNNLPDDTTVHFHGQPVPLGMDGMSGISRPTIAPGQEFIYELDSLVPGTYWYHPHSDAHMQQLDSGLYGALIVDPANTTFEPAYDVEQVIALDDWLQPFQGAFFGHLINGKASAGQTPITVNQGQRLRLRFVNAAATTNYVVALDGHPMTVTHADGHLVIPTTVYALPIGIGERYDVIVDRTNPGTWSLAAAMLQNRTITQVRAVVQYSGQTAPLPAESYVPPNLQFGTLLDYSQLISFMPNPTTATPSRTYAANLGMTMGGSGMQWTINGETYPNVTPMPISQGDVVQIDIASATGSMGMLHPMHLHGHSFRLLGTAGGSTNAPLKDTLLIRPMGQPGSTYSVQFTADNPGRWLFHCHDLMHMMGGMMALFDYTGDADGDGIADNVDMDPGLAHPVLTIPTTTGAFAPGGSGAVSAQWIPGNGVLFLYSFLEANPPIPLPPYGDLYLQPSTFGFLGAAVTASNGYADLPYILPPDPVLSGLRLSLQALSNFGGSLVLSTYQPFTVH